MVNLSRPIPQPAVGGRPYSRDVQKFSSTNMASSSPAALSCKTVAINRGTPVFIYFFYFGVVMVVVGDDPGLWNRTHKMLKLLLLNSVLVQLVEHCLSIGLSQVWCLRAGVRDGYGGQVGQEPRVVPKCLTQNWTRPSGSRFQNYTGVRLSDRKQQKTSACVPVFQLPTFLLHQEDLVLDNGYQQQRDGAKLENTVAI